MKKYPVADAKEDIVWCESEINRANQGGETSPYTKMEWIQCMKNRIAANAEIIRQYGGKPTAKTP